MYGIRIRIASDVQNAKGLHVQNGASLSRSNIRADAISKKMAEHVKGVSIIKYLVSLLRSRTSTRKFINTDNR